MAHFLSSAGIFEIFLFFLAVFIHECGHLLTMLLFGERPTGFRLRPGGAEIRFDANYLPYRKEAKVHLAGPSAGLLTTLVTLWILRMCPMPQLFYFFFCNLFLAVLNLFPIEGLDGYHAIFCLLCIQRDQESAKKILLPYHIAFSWLLFAMGIALWIFEKNPSLILFQILLTEKRKSYDSLVA